MHTDSYCSSRTHGQLEVTLDGSPVSISSDRRSLAAVHAYLETLALEQQRILCCLTVDGRFVDLTQPLAHTKAFDCVEGETIDLREMPLQLLKTARLQVDQARAEVQSAIVTVLINNGTLARECWWKVAGQLKAPLLTMSLLPDTICGPENGRASLVQLRRWQLEQLAGLIKEVDKASWSEDTTALSSALENRVIPWLEQLHEFIGLWAKTVSVGVQAQYQNC